MMMIMMMSTSVMRRCSATWTSWSGSRPGCWGKWEGLVLLSMIGKIYKIRLCILKLENGMLTLETELFFSFQQKLNMLSNLFHIFLVETPVYFFLRIKYKIMSFKIKIQVCILITNIQMTITGSPAGRLSLKEPWPPFLASVILGELPMTHQVGAFK
jgi:hypothetical protein